MDPIQKQALKDLLHMMVDKELPMVLQDLLAKAPAQWASIAEGIFAVGNPIAEQAADKEIDAI